MSMAVTVAMSMAVTVAVAMAVTVAMSMVSMPMPMPVPMFIVSTSMSMGSMAVTVLVVTITVTVAVAVAVTVTIRVTVLVITVAGLTAARPVLTPLVAVALNASRDGYAPLFGVDRVHASVEHPRGKVPAPVLTGGSFLTVLFETDAQCQPGFHVAFIEVTTGLDTVIAQLGGDGFAFLIAGGQLRLFAVLGDALGMRFPSKLDASGFVATWLESIEALLEHCSGGKLTPILTGDAVLRDALGKRFPSKLDASGFVATWLESIEALLEHRGGRELTATLTGRWLGIAAVLCDAVRQRFPGDRSTALFLATVTSGSVFTSGAVFASGSVFTSGSGLGLETAVLDASIVDFPGVALAPIFAGRLLWRRALPGALEEAVDRAPEALLPTDTRVVFRASVEDGKRRPDTIITALAGRNAFAIGSCIENRRKLGPVARSVATAALQKQNGSCKNGEYGCCEFHDCLPCLPLMAPTEEQRAYTNQCPAVLPL
jgi:hypothetical protein